MTLRHLRIFVAVCEEGSVTLAAEKLYLSQPAVSLAIHELEETLRGATLRPHLPQAPILTSAGNRFLEYAVHISSYSMKWSGISRTGIPWAPPAHRLQHHHRCGPSSPKQWPFTPSNTPMWRSKWSPTTPQVIEKRCMANEVDFGLLEGAVHDPQPGGPGLR